MTDMLKEQRDFAAALERVFVPGARLHDVGQGLAPVLRGAVDLDWAAIGMIMREADRVNLLPLADDVSHQLDGQDSIVFGRSPVEWVARNKCAAVEADLSSKSRFSTGAPLLRQGIGSVVYMPLLFGGEVYGSIIVGSHRPKAYGERELKLIKYAATKLAPRVADEVKSISIEPARKMEGKAQTIAKASSVVNPVSELESALSPLVLEGQKLAQEYFSTYVEEGRRSAAESGEKAGAHFAALLHESQERIKEQALIEELVSIIASQDTLSLALQGFSSRLSTRVRFDRIGFSTLHGEGVRVEWTSPDNPPRAGEVYPAVDCGISSTATKGIIVEDDLSHNRQFPVDELYLAQDLRSVIRLPIVKDMRLLGVIELASRQAKAYGDEDIQFLGRLSSQMGLPLERLQLQSMEKERMEFLTALAHEVRTPLTSIISSSKLLREETTECADVLQKRLVENVVQSAERMERRISHFFELAKLRHQGIQLETEVIDIGPVLQELTLRAIPTANSKGQLVLAEMPELLPLVKVDKKRIEQVVLNLLNNAMVFNPKGGVVLLKAKEQNKRLVVEVVDSGPGFSLEEQQEMFKPYYPAEADRQRSPELRLGLAVARELVELHGGTLWMESEEGKGSVFGLSLPKAS